MDDTIVTKVERMERVGPYEVYVSGNAVHVCIRHRLFFPAVLAGKAEDLLRDALKATRKYKSYDRILLLTPEQMELAGQVNFPFKQAGFQKLHLITSETTPVPWNVLVMDMQ